VPSKSATAGRAVRNVLVSVGLIAVLAGCLTRNPATGDQDFTPFMSPDDELKVGAQEHPKILEQFDGVYGDPGVTGYVAEVGGRVAAKSEIPATQFRITVLNTPEMNAFALPGGYVYITRGLMSLMNSEAEMAGVLAHEVGHVTARHTAKRYSQAQGVGIAAAVLGAATGSRALAQLGQAGGQAWLASYSRDQEFQADSLGVRYMSRAGYQPAAQGDILSSLGRYHDFAARINPGKAKGASIFATHPQTPERVRRAYRKAEGKGKPDAPRYRDRFLDHIDGMIYGDDPKNGFVRGRKFSHPTLRFAFEVPEGFQIRNGKAAVLARGPAETVMVFDMDSKATQRSPDNIANYVKNVWARNLRFDKVQGTTINGMAAATGTATVRNKKGQFVVYVAAIRAEKRRLYRFLFSTPVRAAGAMVRRMDETVGSFRRMSAKEAAKLQPLRIRVVTVKRGDTIEDFVKSMAVAQEPKRLFEVLNARTPDQPLKVGERVKVISK